MQFLIAKEQHAELVEGRLDLCESGVVEPLRQIDAANFRADRRIRGNDLNLRHVLDLR